MSHMSDSADSPPVAIAGASGFVGTFLRNELAKRYSFRALTRSPAVAESRNRDSGTEWVTCDLYSPPKVAKALEGCRTAIYLVHSMSPSSRLTQANFADLDLLLADNFIRGAEAAGGGACYLPRRIDAERRRSGIPPLGESTRGGIRITESLGRGDRPAGGLDFRSGRILFHDARAIGPAPAGDDPARVGFLAHAFH